MKRTDYIILLQIVLLAGCGILAPEPAQKELDSALLPPGFSAGVAAEEEKKVLLPEKWWTVFESSELNTLVETAFSNNLDIASAVTRLQQAREQMIITSSAGKFTLSGSGAASVSKVGKITPRISVEGTQSSYGLGLNASYVLDIWGAISSAEESSRLIYNATAEQLNATALLISAQIATAWVEYKTLLQEKDLISAQIETGRQALDLLKVRQRAGLSAAVDVYQQESQVAALERLLPQIDEQGADLCVQINYLLGAPASASLPVAIKSESLPAADALPSCGVPADLLDNRPDIRASWLTLQSQEWTVSARKADRFPAVTLSGSLGFEDNDIAEVLRSWYANLAAGVVGPILDGGQRAAKVRLAEAQADEAFISYTDTVLQALMEVEQALSRDKTRQSYLAAVEREIDLNDTTLKESINRYRKGLMEYLNVLTALSSKQSSERRALEARSSLMFNRISLYQALGGGSYFMKGEL